jgi:hypothetical protein
MIPGRSPGTQNKSKLQMDGLGNSSTGSLFFYSVKDGYSHEAQPGQHSSSVNCHLVNFFFPQEIYTDVSSCCFILRTCTHAMVCGTCSFCGRCNKGMGSSTNQYRRFIWTWNVSLTLPAFNTFLPIGITAMGLDALENEAGGRALLGGFCYPHNRSALLRT